MESQMTVTTTSPEQTFNFGEGLGRILGKGDVVALVGDLGAGKTTLTQGIARGLGVSCEWYVTSPTFTLINEYPGRLPVYHLDCYRLDSPSEIEDLGMEEYLQGDGVAIIEWAEKIDSLLPEDYVRIVLEYIDQSVRKMRVQAFGEHFQTLLKRHSGCKM
jgi:tRNA threonylcarbamoyladenosine biosynthesis protein TsaE